MTDSPRTDHAAPPRLAAIQVYPFKSAAGIAVEAHPVDQVGLRWDRRWMAVDASGRFLSQRTHPRLALLRPSLGQHSLHLATPDGRTLSLPLAPTDPGGGLESIHVWFQHRHACDCGPAAAEWISSFLDLPARIVRAAEPVGAPPIAPDGKVRAGFADAEPALVLSTASLDDLNRRLRQPVTMDRFRPNLVVAGIPPYAEERWDTVRIGDVRLHGIRPCPRCSITTIDPVTALRGREPLRTLARYRRRPDGSVPFGMNCGFDGPGTLTVGAPITVESRA